MAAMFPALGVKSRASGTGLVRWYTDTGMSSLSTSAPTRFPKSVLAGGSTANQNGLEMVAGSPASRMIVGPHKMFVVKAWVV